MPDDNTPDDGQSKATSEKELSELGPEQEEDVLGAAPTEPALKKRRLRLPRRGDGERKPIRVSRKTVIVTAVILVPILLVALVPIVAGAFKKTPRDKYGLSYGGGPIEGAHFIRVVKPGTGLFFNGFFRQLYLYPADQRNYIVSKVRNQG